MKREVWRRAGGQCEWRFESGERCGCRRRLQYDHVDPLALGGTSTVENIRLLCAPHNRLAARKIFGNAVMDRYARSSREKQSRPFGAPAKADGSRPLTATAPPPA